MTRNWLRRATSSREYGLLINKVASVRIRLGEWVANDRRIWNCVLSSSNFDMSACNRLLPRLHVLNRLWPDDRAVALRSDRARVHNSLQNSKCMVASREVRVAAFD